VNAASYALDGLPNSAIAQGSMFVIFGSGLGPATLQQARFPLPVALGGTSVKVTVGGSTVNAILIYTSANQVACVLPSATPIGAGVVTVTYNNVTSAPASITVVRSSFGIFTINQAGNGPGVITDTNWQVNLLTRAAGPSEVMVLWGTGLGPVAFDETRGAPSEDMRSSDVQVFVGGKPAELLFRGRAPGYSGLDQINFRVPPGLEGCYVPVAVKVAGLVSNFTSLSISSRKKVCSDPLSHLDTDLERARDKDDFRVAYLQLVRTEMNLPGVGNITSDTGDGSFFRYNFRKLIGAVATAGLAPLGHCTVYTFRGTDYAFKDPVAPEGLDAGRLSVTGPLGEKQFKQNSKGEYSAQLGGGIPGLGGQPEYLVKGYYSLTGSGGAEVGAFSAALVIPDPIRWINRDSINDISRSQDLKLSWTGGDPNKEMATIIGLSLRTAPEVGAAFVCTERAAALSFSVPSLVLSALPPSPSGSAASGTPAAMLMLGSAPILDQSRFKAPGLDAGFFYYTLLNGKTVTFR